MTHIDNWVDPIKDQVAFDYGYISYENWKKLLKENDFNAWVDFDAITAKIAREYGKDVENNLDESDEIENREQKIEDLEDEIIYLEDKINDVEGENQELSLRIAHLELKLSQYE